MNQLFPSIAQMKKLWLNLAPAARVGTIITIVVCVGLIGFVGYWSSQPEYVTLVNDLETTKAAKVIDILANEKISAKLSFSGKSVLVDSRRWNDARVAVADIVEPNQLDSGGAGGSWSIMDPSKKNHWLAEQKEHGLAKTISQMKQVELATVNLAIPDATAFVRNRETKTASVVLQLRPGIPFGQRNAQAIVMIVANSVEGMQPENVTVTDTAGNMWTGQETGAMGGMSGQIDMRRNYERELEQKAESQLIALLGSGRAIVKITADMDFTHMTTEKNTPIAGTKVKLTEETSDDKQTSAQQMAFGATGTTSNTGRGTASSGDSGVTSHKTTSNITYQPSAQKEIEVLMPGRVKRISVSATVQLNDASAVTVGDAETADAAATPAASAITIDQIKEVIKMAVGFDDKRKDQITVLEGELKGMGEIADLFQPTDSIWTTIGPVARDISLGVAALVALVLGMMTLKKFRPLEIGSEEDSGVTPQRARQVSDMMRLAKSNPEILATVLAAWANEEQDSPDMQSKKRAA